MGKNRRYDHPKRQHDKHSAVLRRLHSPESPIIDVAFVKLHEELQQWPDGWVVDKHGDLDGSNPHVWLPFKAGYEMVGRRIKVEGLRQYPNMPAPQPGSAVHAWSLVEPDELRCTCGMLKSDYDVYVRLELSGEDARYAAAGLFMRDVQ